MPVGLFRKSARLIPLLLAACWGTPPRGQTPQTEPDIRVDVDLVTVACTVTDRNGAPVQGLRREDFVLKDAGTPQPTKYLWKEMDLPLTIGIVVDVSGSQTGLVGQHRNTVAEFLTRVVGPQDRAFLVTVARQQKLVTDTTNSQAELLAGVEKIERGQKYGELLGDRCTGERRGFLRRKLGCGGTALWNGVYFATLLKLRPASGRKALVVITDGWDTGSDHGLVDAIEAAQSAGAVVYTIRYVSPFMRSFVLNPPAGAAIALSRTWTHGLERIAEETGGSAFKGSKKEIPRIFGLIEEELRSQYVLGFTPPETARDGKFRKLEIATVRPGLVVHARKGYYASMGAANGSAPR